MQRIRNWRPSKTQLAVASGIVVLLVFVTAVVVTHGTGFNGATTISTTRETNTTTGETTEAIAEQRQPGKTLWDWMQLLIRPLS